MCEDAERFDVTELAWVRARKPRECAACGCSIASGQIYHRYTSLYEGRWETVDHCPTCWAICEALWAQPGVEAIDLELRCGELWSRNFGPEPDDVAALAFEVVEEAQDRAELEYGLQQLQRQSARAFSKENKRKNDDDEVSRQDR